MHLAGAGDTHRILKSLMVLMMSGGTQSAPDPGLSSCTLHRMQLLHKILLQDRFVDHIVSG